MTFNYCPIVGLNYYIDEEKVMTRIEAPNKILKRFQRTGILLRGMKKKQYHAIVLNGIECRR